MSFIKFYEQKTGRKLPDPNKLSDEAKWYLTRQLKNSGERINDIAEYFGKSRQTIWAWHKKSLDSRLNEIECNTFLDIFMQDLVNLEDTRDELKRDAERIRALKDNNWLDQNGELVTNKSDYLRHLEAIQRNIITYEKLIIDYKSKIGLMPSDTSGLFGSLSEMNPENVMEDNETNLSDEEVNTRLMERLFGKKPMLREIKDEKVL